MDNSAFDSRRKALEEAFFSKQNQDLIKKLHEQKAGEQNKAELQAATGLCSEAVLTELIAKGLTVKTMAALVLLPHVAVAWADGQMEPKERQAILKAADEHGVVNGSDAYQLLAQWLDAKPAEGVFQAWKDYVGALKEIMDPAAYTDLKTNVIDGAKHVADIAGGLLGMGSISGKEKAVLADLEGAFS